MRSRVTSVRSSRSRSDPVPRQQATTARRGYRAGASLTRSIDASERVDEPGGCLVEVGRDRDASVPTSRLTTAAILGEGDESSHGSSRLGYDDVLAGRGTLDEAGQVGLGLVDVYQYGLILRSADRG